MARGAWAPAGPAAAPRPSSRPRRARTGPAGGGRRGCGRTRTGVAGGRSGASARLRRDSSRDRRRSGPRRARSPRRSSTRRSEGIRFTGTWPGPSPASHALPASPRKTRSASSMPMKRPAGAVLAIAHAVAEVEAQPRADLELGDDGAVAERGVRRIDEAPRGAGEGAESVARHQVGAAERDPALDRQAIAADPAVGAEAGVHPQAGSQPRIAPEIEREPVEGIAAAGRGSAGARSPAALPARRRRWCCARTVPGAASRWRRARGRYGCRGRAGRRW